MADAVDAAAGAVPPYWSQPPATVLASVGGRPEGLTDAEAAARAPHQRAHAQRPALTVAHELARQFSQPVVVVLLCATALSLVLGDHVDALIIAVIVLLSGLLGFWQEHGAAVTVARLLDRVQVHVEVRRSGRVVSVRPEEVVVGDVVLLDAGDVIPCDCRVLVAEALQADQSALTGETYPRHKHADPAPTDAPLADRHSALLQGGHVVSGRGEAVAVVTGAHTELGRMSRVLTARSAPTSFEQGTARLGLLLARVTLGLTAVILVVNVVLGRPLVDALLFSLALAVGVTPQMLPAIVAVSLSTGARRMAASSVIVRRLDAIEDLGSMDVLCTDKTGTLTTGVLRLAATVDATGVHSPRVADRAALNAALQTGFTNPLDDAVLRAVPRPADRRALDEVPFDFDRKRLSVLVDGEEAPVLVTKGAYRSVLAVCDRLVGPDGAPTALDTPAREALEARIHRLSAGGRRVLAVAERRLPGRTAVTVDDEQGMVLLGLLAFEDPPKDDVARTVADLAELGIRLVMLTGDNRLVAADVARAVGVTDPRVLTGLEVEAADADALRGLVRSADAFAELTPTHKERVIEAFRADGAVVGYLGDGINDAGPLHLADVGISVDTAVDVAKSAAAMVLLEKDLGVLVRGVRLGRQTFTNTLKYVYTTVSANFGNTASMAAASAFLPFLPLLPRQILLLNFLSDLPSVTLAGDRVDPEDVRRPRRWDLRQVRDFMVVFGMLSSAFDLLTFALLLQVLDAGATLFRTGWFVGSTLTELAVLFVLRSRRPSWRSRPGVALVLTSALVAGVTVSLPFVPAVRPALGLGQPSVRLVLLLVAVTGCYVVAAELTKRVFFRGGRAGPSTAPPPTTTQQRRLRHVAREHRHPVATTQATSQRAAVSRSGWTWR
ncbi:magnesium-translocating P-type ATPase [Phycicoccus sp.]|uniref:magnesium-translocating P-type ATPase n=1 Tax=Phycicoccus sp. TaxID=1902410 RepID=UPI002C2AFD7F|nr:magnesium-translocating P-type ATPase [Phycicoccus sp.]HMM95842.1 magnesium-translocating P-type ATPase [Phycicoccus sp.]